VVNPRTLSHTRLFYSCYQRLPHTTYRLLPVPLPLLVVGGGHSDGAGRRHDSTTNAWQHSHTGWRANRAHSPWAEGGAVGRNMNAGDSLFNSCRRHLLLWARTQRQDNNRQLYRIVVTVTDLPGRAGAGSYLLRQHHEQQWTGRGGHHSDAAPRSAPLPPPPPPTPSPPPHSLPLPQLPQTCRHVAWKDLDGGQEPAAPPTGSIFYAPINLSCLSIWFTERRSVVDYRNRYKLNATYAHGIQTTAGRAGGRENSSRTATFQAMVRAEQTQRDMRRAAAFRAMFCHFVLQRTPRRVRWRV